MRRWTARLGWLVLAGILVAVGARGLARSPGAPVQGDSLGVRLLAPVAAPLAAYERLQAEVAFLEGRVGAGFERLERALALAPTTTVLWESLVERQGLWLASELREGDPDRRRRWIVGALSSADRGTRRADRPARVARSAGLVLVQQARSESPPTWPGGVPGLYEEAARWFERAAALGDTRAATWTAWCERQAAGAELDADD